MNITVDQYSREFNKLPDFCPHCFIKQIPQIKGGVYNSKINLNLFLICSNEDCKKSFIAFYSKAQNSSALQLSGVSIGNLQTKEFSSDISSISEKFIEIYNQAFFAEQNNLFEITGVGYRKSLEFLIKDYCLKNNTSESEKILNMPIMQVINSYVNDERIKNISKRAVWLGNDETHYIRIWDNKDVTILKTLIDLVVHWIEMEEMSKLMIIEMPELPKKGNDKK
ncbi:DUF4145 domain-containing protein (plasmid) [Chryseobacterium sp. SNU WT5]|uniref:DUF4145 domain-containing protein n=1 Tax=Chryseobacterium sp. SNU WT5 TaxID=2594269 RepID=UPI00117C7C0C|nr:DUF4145 domain-containing protein [Chryseobacterium sp. SNU WT5]QDP86741.1 DUF4145 domain-containing protein [Chryseobacterium sp. SNU WT5]